MTDEASTGSKQEWRTAGERAYKALPFWRRFLLLADPSAASTWMRAVNQTALISELTDHVEVDTARIRALEAALRQCARRIHNLQHPAHRTFETCDIEGCVVARAALSREGGD